MIPGNIHYRSVLKYYVTYFFSGTPAFVGFQNVTGKKVYSLPGSGTEQVLLLQNTSNIGEPGIWVFRIDDQFSIESGGI